MEQAIVVLIFLLVWFIGLCIVVWIVSRPFIWIMRSENKREKEKGP